MQSPGGDKSNFDQDGADQEGADQEGADQGRADPTGVDLTRADLSGEVEPQHCSIASALDVVGDRWTILILRDVFRGIRRFDVIRRDLDIPRAVLSERLRRLVDDGILVKRPYQDRPARYEYRLTPMGRELSPILVSLMQWGDRWLAEGAEPPTRLVHEPCGTEIDLGYYCWECETAFGPTDICADNAANADSASSADKESKSA